MLQSQQQQWTAFLGRGLVKVIEALPQLQVTQPRADWLAGFQRPSFGSSFWPFARFLALIDVGCRGGRFYWANEAPQCYKPLQGPS